MSLHVTCLAFVMFICFQIELKAEGKRITLLYKRQIYHPLIIKINSFIKVFTNGKDLEIQGRSHLNTANVENESKYNPNNYYNMLIIIIIIIFLII